MPRLDIPVERPPIFIGAGVIKTDEEIRRYADIPEVAAQIIGSFSENEHSGNDPSGTKRVFYYNAANQAAYNAIGLRNPGRQAASEYLPKAIKAVKAAGQLAIVAVTPLKHEDPTKVVPSLVEWAAEMGADGVEVNGSCPNEGSDGVLCDYIQMTKRVMAAARERVGSDVYLLLKASPLGETAIRQYKRDLDVNGITAINNRRRMSPSDVSTGMSTIEVNEGLAGQSGPVISSLARTNLRSWLRPRTGPANFPAENSRFDVWSIGGVDNGFEIYDRVHNIGALLVGGAQAFYRSDDPAGVAKRWASEYRVAAAAMAA